MERERIIEHHVKARDIRRTDTSLFVPEGLTVFITLSNMIPACSRLFRSLSLPVFCSDPKPFAFMGLLQKNDLVGWRQFKKKKKCNSTHTMFASNLRRVRWWALPHFFVWMKCMLQGGRASRGWRAYKVQDLEEKFGLRWGQHYGLFWYRCYINISPASQSFPNINQDLPVP